MARWCTLWYIGRIKNNIKIVIITTREEAKHLSDVLKAYSEGKQIQWRNRITDEWIDCSDTPAFNIEYLMYRIKPEPKYRPYANTEEFLNAQKEHGLYLISKNKRDRARIPVIVQPEKIFMYWLPGDSCPSEYTYSALLAYWLHQDGTPCGIVEE